MSSRELQQVLATVNVKVHDSTIRKRLHQFGFQGRCARRKPLLKRNWILQHDNDPKHTTKITKEWIHNNHVNILEKLSQNPDLNPIDHLWRDLKMTVHQRFQSNLPQLERICKEERQSILKSRCEKHIASFPKRLMAVLDQKGASTKY
uniref:Transposase Tc1-like domain-containing protein n=1 Tax=Denticeps clupeoides TaxID=299321 RepID=A0AAY4CR32_9TELE